MMTTLTTGDIVAFVGLFATFITACATLITVIEMRRQRRSTYLPDLFLGNAFADFIGFDRTHKYSTFEFSKKDNSEKNWKYVQKPDSQVQALFLQIFNIGFAAAKYVECECRFDFEKIYNLLDGVNTQNRFTITYDTDEDEPSISITTTEGDHFNWLLYDIDFRTTQIDFVEPASVSKTVYEIQVPRAYIESLCYYIVLKHQMFSEDAKAYIYDTLDEFPELFLHIKYKDIGRKDHSKKFKMKLGVSGWVSRELSQPVFGRHPLGSLKIDCSELR